MLCRVADVQVSVVQNDFGKSSREKLRDRELCACEYTYTYTPRRVRQALCLSLKAGRALGEVGHDRLYTQRSGDIDGFVSGGLTRVGLVCHAGSGPQEKPVHRIAAQGDVGEDVCSRPVRQRGRLSNLAVRQIPGCLNKFLRRLLNLAKQQRSVARHPPTVRAQGLYTGQARQGVGFSSRARRGFATASGSRSATGTTSAAFNRRSHGHAGSGGPLPSRHGALAKRT